MRVSLMTESLRKFYKSVNPLPNPLTFRLSGGEMLSGIYEKLQSASGVAMVIISVALMLFCGFAATRITKRLRLPNVTAYILTGILLGPYCLKLIPQSVTDGMAFLADIALAFIAFSTGEFFRLDVLKKNGWKVVVITVWESLFATLLVFVVAYVVLGIDLAFSVVLAALAAATAPASTVVTIRQLGAKGSFVETLLQVVALDDVVGLVAYSVAISIAIAGQSGGFHITDVIQPIFVNAGILLLGGVFGVLMKLLMPKKRSTDNRLIISISLLFAFCGVCALLDVSPLLGCMSMGTVYINITDDDKLFKQLNYFSPPILLLFFVRSGLNFRLDVLVDSSEAVGAVPLIVIGVLYFLTRIVGKYGGAFLGGLMVRTEKRIRNYLGLALIPQAGVAIGLAELGARTIGGEMGEALRTIILASSVLYELIGPACAKLSLYLSHSYGNPLDEPVPVTADGTVAPPQSEVERLIARIDAIQKELPAHTNAMSEEEQAFMEGAEEMYDNQWHLPHRLRRR